MSISRHCLLATVCTITATHALAQEPKKDLYGDPLPPGAVARIGTVRMRHPSDLSQVALSPDGKLLVTKAERSLRLWNGETGKLIKEILLPIERGIVKIAFAKDLRQFHALFQDGTLRAFNIGDGKWSEVLARTAASPESG